VTVDRPRAVDREPRGVPPTDAELEKMAKSVHMPKEEFSKLLEILVDLVDVHFDAMLWGWEGGGKADLDATLAFTRESGRKRELLLAGLNENQHDVVTRWARRVAEEQFQDWAQRERGKP
jgi:hypothetical protein